METEIIQDAIVKQ